MRKLALLSALLVTLLAGPVTDAHATHFRYGHISWAKTGATAADFTFTGAFRRDGYTGTAGDGFPAIGDVISEDIGATSFNYGDGAFTGTLDLVVTAINPTDNWLIAKALDPARDVGNTSDTTLSHSYATAGPFTADVSGCCALSTLNNNADGSYSVKSLVDFTNDSQSPVSSVPPIVDIGDTGVQTFNVPAIDSGGQKLHWRLAIAGEACDLDCNPPGLSIDANTGQASWDTTGVTGGLWFAAVVVEALDNSDNVVSSSQVNFLINVSSNVTNAPPAWDTPTPADNTEFNVNAGSPLSINLQAFDPDELQTVHIDNLGLPTGATMTPTDGNPATATLDWTPTETDVGDYLVTVTAQDNGDPARSAPSRTFVIHVQTADTTPKLKVVKQVVNDDGGGGAAGDFSLHVKASGVDVTGSPQPGSTTGTTYSLDAGDYVVSEDGVNGYARSFSGDCDAQGAVNLQTGDSKTCTVTNNDVPSPPPGDCVTYNDFGTTPNLNLVGAAAVSGTALRLNPASGNQTGLAWYGNRVPVADGFDTQFQFQISERGGIGDEDGAGADGFTFAIQNAGVLASGSIGGGLGYMDLENILVVEFDTYNNGGDDPNGNHIAVDYRGAGDPGFTQLGAAPLSNGLGEPDPLMQDGSTHTGRIVYNGTTGVLSVYIDGSLSPRLSVPVNLTAVLDLDGINGYVGFTAATGSGFENHDVLNWSYCVDTTPTERQLSVTKTGTGTGGVTSSPAGIDCGATCEANFTNGATVTLTATPGAGSTFTGWSGEGCSGTAQCVVTMDTARSVTAEFTDSGVQQFALGVTKDGTGTGSVTSAPAGIDCGATCSANFDDGTSVTLSAVADSGSSFTGWSGEGCSGTGDCIVTMSQARSVTATFTLSTTQFTLSVTKDGTGTGTVTSDPAGIDCGGTCSAQFDDGTSVTLSAVAGTGSTFDGWSGAGCSGTADCVVTMSQARSVTATFSGPPIGVKHLTTVHDTDYKSFGFGGMRDNGTGTIDVTGISGTVTRAYLFWHGPTNSTDATTGQQVTFAGQQLNGTFLGASADNCWSYAESHAYRVDVTPLVAGNGSYSVSGLYKSIPGDNVNGVSLLVFYDDGNSTNNRDIVVFNGNDSNTDNQYDANGWNVSLPGINYSSGTAAIEMHVSDGQAFDDDALQLNAQELQPAGGIFEGNTTPHGSFDASGDLWDIKSWDITSFLTAGTNNLQLTTGFTSDCLSLVVAAISLPASAAPPLPEVTLTTPADGSTTSDTTPSYSGTAGDAAGDSTTVTVKIYAGSSASGTPVQTLTTTRSGTSWSVNGDPALANGTYTAQAEQEGTNGTGFSAPHTFGVNTNVPRFLTVSKSGTGTGTVTSNPAGVNCGGTCSAAFDNGTSVTLHATADTGSTFSGWSGSGCAGTGDCVVTMSQARAVTAEFTADSTTQFTLNVSKNGTGTGSVTSDPAGIDCGSTCAAQYDDGASVTLTAAPDTGSTFTGWSGAGCSGTGDCQVTMSQARSVTATFTQSGVQQFALGVTEDGTGTGSVTSAPAGIDCGATCSAQYDDGTSVTLTATANSGSTFTGWSGSGCSGTGDCILTMDQARSVTATFTLNPPPQRTLTVSKSGTGAGGVTSNPAGIDCGATCSAQYDDGTSVTLTATAASGSTFTGWSGACTGTGTCTVTTDQARSVDAEFTLIPPPPARTLTVTKSGTGTGTATSAPSGINCGATCSASYANGTSVTLTAAADTGSTFAGWSGEGCTGVGTCTVTMDAARAVTATFNTSGDNNNGNGSGNGVGPIKTPPGQDASGMFCGTQHKGQCNGLKFETTFEDSPGNATWQFGAFGTSNKGRRVRLSATKILKLGTVKKRITKNGTVKVVFKLKNSAKARKLLKQIRKQKLDRLQIKVIYKLDSGETITKIRNIKLRYSK